MLTIGTKKFMKFVWGGDAGEMYSIEKKKISQGAINIFWRGSKCTVVKKSLKTTYWRVPITKYDCTFGKRREHASSTQDCSCSAPTSYDLIGKQENRNTEKIINKRIAIAFITERGNCGVTRDYRVHDSRCWRVGAAYTRRLFYYYCTRKNNNVIIPLYRIILLFIIL